MLLHYFVSATPRAFPHSAISGITAFCNFWQAFLQFLAGISASAISGISATSLFSLPQFLAFPQLRLFPFRLWFSFVSFRAFKVHGMWCMQWPSFHFVYGFLSFRFMLSRCMGCGVCNGFIVSHDRNISIVCSALPYETNIWLLCFRLYGFL